MSDPYGLPDLSHLATGRNHFPVNQQTLESYFFHRNLVTSCGSNNEAMVFPGGHIRFGHQPDNFAAAAHNPVATSANLYGVDMEISGWGNFGNNEGGNCRWPRQETLTLLDIRSRLDSKFKEANQKKPLWDEVSRIMTEEHGYHRSEKKCREKFENLYKYYKKTKEGKAGRQDGKHYRFFRQLEALYGETSNNQNSVLESHLDRNTTNFVCQTPNQENQETFQEHKLSDQSLSNFSNTSESSGNNDHDDLSAIAFMMNQKSMEKHKGVNDSHQSGQRVKRSWKAKVKEFVDAQMRELMESQEAWMERMLKTIEVREQERLFKEEEWRKQEMARLDQVHESWARERAWIVARDKALMQALKKATSGRELQVPSTLMKNNNNNQWNEPETSSLIQLIISLEPEFEQSGYLDESIWEEIAGKMASFGYYRSAIEFKEKWENMKMYFKKATWSNNKNQTSSSCSSYGHDQIAKQRLESMELLLPSNNSYAGKQVHESSCFNILINKGQQKLWEKGKFKQT